jgi:hypothetical protein
MASDSVEYIRLKNQINIELRQVMTEVDDLAKTHVHEMERKGAKMTLEEVNARKEVMASIIGACAFMRMQDRGFRKEHSFCRRIPTSFQESKRIYAPGLG